MPLCPVESSLNAYVDGELDPERRAAVERHLAGCASCAAELAQLRSLAALFVASPPPALLPIMRRRLHDRVEVAMERGLRRIAWALSGVAASVLVAGSVWMMLESQTQSPAVAPPPWVEVAASSAASTAQATPAAQWYLADASGRTDELP